jgi:hypothetical protein
MLCIGELMGPMFVEDLNLEHNETLEQAKVNREHEDGRENGKGAGRDPVESIIEARDGLGQTIRAWTS